MNRFTRTNATSGREQNLLTLIVKLVFFRSLAVSGTPNMGLGGIRSIPVTWFTPYTGDIGNTALISPGSSGRSAQRQLRALHLEIAVLYRKNKGRKYMNHGRIEHFKTHV